MHTGDDYRQPNRANRDIFQVEQHARSIEAKKCDYNACKNATSQEQDYCRAIGLERSSQWRFRWWKRTKAIGTKTRLLVAVVFEFVHQDSFGEARDDLSARE
jgi:hypothetical protein